MNHEKQEKTDKEMQTELVVRDQTLSHAVVVVDVEAIEEDMAGMLIEDAMTELNKRALAASMVILSTTITATAYTVNNRGHMVYVVAAQWMGRDTLEKLQRQQQIIGGPNGGGPLRRV